MQPYFSRFPTIQYSNTDCLDLTKRVIFDGNGRQSPYVFYPYTLKEGLRPDHVAEYYYDDPELDWMVLIANQVIDPYYDWYLSDDKFNALMVEKFGSIANAMKKVKFYRNNWYNDYNEISVAEYESIIDKDRKKYYTPVMAPNFKITGYKRKPQDVQMNTNRVYQYEVTYNGANTFTVGEIVDIKLPGFDATIGGGEVVLANTTAVRIQSISGNTSANSSFQKNLVGETSKANANAVSRTLIYQNISESEEVFWSPVYLYEYYQELNEQRKNINLVGDGLVSLVVSDFTNKLQSNE